MLDIVKRALHFDRSAVEEGILSDFGEVLPEDFSYLADPSALTERLSSGSLLSDFLESLFGTWQSGGGYLFLFAFVAIIGAVFGLFAERLPKSATLGASLIFTSLLFGALYEIAEKTIESLSELSSLFFGFGTVLSTVTASGGAVASAGAESAGIALTMAVFGSGGTHIGSA